MIVVERSFKYLDEIELSFVRGIGEKKFASLKKSKLKTVADLIRYFPRTHIDRSKVKLISEIDNNDENNDNNDDNNDNNDENNDKSDDNENIDY